MGKEKFERILLKVIIMKNITKTIIATIMIMVMVLTSATPITTEAKTAKTSITVTNKATGKKIGKKLSLTTGKKVQLTVKYGKTNVTKKAKYEASNKNVTVSKKGKITAKKVGTATVTIKYKKIKVTVKANVVQSATEQATTEQATTEQTKQKASKEELENFVEQFVESNKTDPHPECVHEWEIMRCQSDIDDDLVEDGRWIPSWQEHLFVDRIKCKKCGAGAYLSHTTPVYYKEAVNYTNDDFNNAIVGYCVGTTSNRKKQCPKHTCKKGYGWTPPAYPGDCWFYDDRCIYCDKEYN